MIALKLKEKLAQIRLAVFDVDGVLTDGRIMLMSDQREVKTFHVHDGMGLRALKEAGVEVAIISARDKGGRMQKLLDLMKIDPEHALFVGDDLQDWPAMRLSGVKITVPNGAPELRDRCDYVTSQAGGMGAVREVAELVLKAQDRWKEVLKYFLLD
jgi:3-deoxy-D-manno-octulosonate 8-phosphate phosphatase (KDO 8-P phosphatase)